MKKLMALFILCTCILPAANAQDYAVNDSVPEAVGSTLRQKFPDVVKPKWRWMDMFYIAAFNYDGEEHYVKIDPAGNWIRTFIRILPEKLPATVKRGISKTFPGYATTGAWRVNDVLHGECFMGRLQKGSEMIDVLFSTNEGEVLDRQASEKRLFAK